MSLSEIRVNTTKTRTGVGTITYTETGPVITGIATASNFKTGSTNVHSTGVEVANINTSGSTATFGGPISGTTASFSGNVSIGGTLTYEDVTNIDSVGIVTAREGVFIPDTKKLQLGNAAGSADLEIFHDGSHSYIKDTGTGDLVLQGTNNVWLQHGNGENALKATQDAGVELRFNNIKKIETDLDGIRIGSGGGDNTIVDLHNASYDNGVIQYYNGSINLKTGTSNGDRQISLETAGSPRLIIKSDGKIGVGINAPGEKLDVSGWIQSTSGLKVAGHPIATYAGFTDISGGSYATRLGSTGSSTLRSTQIYGGGGHIATFDGVNQRLGINIAVPTKKLDISTDASADGIRIKSTGNTYNELSFDANRTGATNHLGRIISYWNGTAVSYISMDSGSDTTNKDDGIIRFWTANGSGNFERLRIDSNGRVNIGAAAANTTIHASGLFNGATPKLEIKLGGASNSYKRLINITNPGAQTGSETLGRVGIKLSLGSEGSSGESNKSGIIYAESTSGYNNGTSLCFATANAERFRIDSNGNVIPATNNTYDLGSVAKGWRNVYTNDLNLSNLPATGNDSAGNPYTRPGNDVDGTNGSWTIQEGKDDLYIINRVNGKKYKFNLTEVS